MSDDERVDLTDELLFKGVILGYLDEETNMTEDEKDKHSTRLAKELVERRGDLLGETS